MRERRVADRVLVGRPEGERDRLEGLGVDGRIILQLVFKMYDGGDEPDWSGEGQVASCCEHDNELSSSIKYGGFFFFFATCGTLASQEGLCFVELLVGYLIPLLLSCREYIWSLWKGSIRVLPCGLEIVNYVWTPSVHTHWKSWQFYVINKASGSVMRYIETCII